MTDAPSPVLAAPIPDGSVAQSTGKGPEVPGTDALIVVSSKSAKAESKSVGADDVVAGMTA
jgi:hypothetical protein